MIVKLILPGNIVWDKSGWKRIKTLAIQTVLDTRAGRWKL